MIIEKEHLQSRGSVRSFVDEGSKITRSPAGSCDVRTTRSGKQFAAPTPGRDQPSMDHEPQEKKSETFNFIATCEMYPEWLRKGPWSPLTSVYLVAFFFALVWSFPLALESAGATPTEPPSATLTTLRVACGAWGLGFCAYFLVSGWVWVFASYTGWSWTLSSVYFVASAVRDLASGQIVSVASWVAAAVRFPALVQVSVTVVLWWLVLVPMITSLSPAKNRMPFIKFNFSFVMLNIHGAVFPAVLADFLLASTPLSFFELWTSFVIGFAYIVWYLSFLDPHGIHLYIFLSPRTHASPLIYSAILGLYTACYVAYNASVGAQSDLLGFTAFSAAPA